MGAGQILPNHLLGEVADVSRPRIARQMTLSERSDRSGGWIATLPARRVTRRSFSGGVARVLLPPFQQKLGCPPPVRKFSRRFRQRLGVPVCGIFL